MISDMERFEGSIGINNSKGEKKMEDKAELRKKLENLERRKRELVAEKKRDMKLKNEEIKEVDDDMGDILELLDEV